MISFDKILESHIRTGVYQFKSITVIGLLEFCDGIEYTFMSILIAILRNDWNLSTFQISTLSSIYFIGGVIGNFLCALIADIIGRRRCFIIFNAISVILVIWVSFAGSYEQMLYLRLLFGIVFGLTPPLGSVYVSEIVVAKYRGRFTFTLSILFILGKMYLTALCFIFLDNYESGNWRGLIRFNAWPLALNFLGSLIYLKESIRYLMHKGQYALSFQHIEDISEENLGIQNKLALTDQEKDGLIQWQLQTNKVNAEQQNVNGLLSPQFRGITLKLWAILIIANLENMSIYLLMPFLFQANNSGFGSMLWLFTIEFFATLLIYQLVDNKQFGGRVRILMAGSILLVVTNLSLYLFHSAVLFIGLLAIKIGTKSIYAISLIITCESYPLRIRSKGFGIAQGVGKLSSIPAPYLVFYLYAIHPYLPFLFMFVAAFILFAISYTYPTDKTQRYLEDSSSNDDYIQEAAAAQPND